MTQIIKDRPPNYQEILLHFPDANRPGVIFAYAPYIYAPSGNVPPELVDHEKVHIARQQKIGVEEWWRRYLTSPEFRFQEEVLAHRAEYRHIVQHGTRFARRRALKELAKRLSGPLYGKMCKPSMAEAIIEAPECPITIALEMHVGP